MVAAFYPVAEAAQRVGGSCVTVQNLTPAGAEPHDLELTPDQVDAIQDATVVFVMGHGFQPGVEDAADQRDGATVKLLDGLHAKQSDPHVWLDPARYSELVELSVPSVAARGTEMPGPDRAQHSQVPNGDQPGGRRRTRTGSAPADATRSSPRTRHSDTWPTATTSSSRASRASHLTRNPTRSGSVTSPGLVQRDGITTIFTETLVSRRVADALAREAGGVKTETLNPLEGLTDGQIEHGDDWASVMGENLAKLRKALGCRACTPSDSRQTTPVARGTVVT